MFKVQCLMFKVNRYFIYLSYDGTRYHGWQVQPNGITVQEEIERALSTLLRQKTEIVGAGRTDAGVHARLMVAHFDTDVAIDEVQLTYKLNRFLPHDIAIKKIKKVDNELHARFSATSRTYHYYVHTAKNPFARAYSWETNYPLDFPKMNLAAQALLTTTDFAAFCKSGSDVKTTLCNVTKARWNEIGEGRWYFEISANRFLRNMVRAVVGTLIEVGRGRMSVEEFADVIKSGSRSNAGESMPANALFLEDVKYPSTPRST